MATDDQKAPPAPAAATPAEQPYFFPQYGKTVMAISKEDAEKKIAELQKNNQ